MKNPGFVTLNGHRIKVQRWLQESNAITFTTVIHGEYLGNNVVAAMETPLVTLVLDDQAALAGTARLLDRRASGAGPTAVTRLEIQFTMDEESATINERTPDQKLDAILAELRELRRDVHALQGRPTTPTGGVAPPAPGKTMIDFEIPLEEMEN